MYDVTNEERALSWSSDGAPVANGLANGDREERGAGRDCEEDVEGGRALEPLCPLYIAS